MELIGEFLGYLAGICTAIVFLPQSLQTIKTRDTTSLSKMTYIVYCVGMVSWILYGIYLHSIQMILFNAISLFFALIILYIIFQNKANKK